MSSYRAARLFSVLVVLLPTWATASTIATGDRIQGVPVITQLDVSDLEAGKKHRFFFQGVEMGSGQHWDVPVLVAKGAKPGKRVLLVAGVHGDELTPFATVQQVFAKLDPATLSGTVIGILGVNRPGTEFVTRNWPMNSMGITWVNPNRSFPGDENGNSVERQNWLVVNRLIAGNADAALDFHTGGNGIDFALFIFAYANSAESMQLADLFPVDQIKADPGLPGTLEYELVKKGIPSVTVELGGPRAIDREKTRIGVEGTENVLAHFGMTGRSVGRSAKDANVFRGNHLEDVVAVTGGFVEYRVGLNDEVKKGQTLAVQRDAFGDVVHEYVSPADGRIAILGTDAIRERGGDIASILTIAPNCPKEGCPYDGAER